MITVIVRYVHAVSLQCRCFARRPMLVTEVQKEPSIDWAAVDLNRYPRVVTEVPGPRSRQLHEKATHFMKGYSSQVTLCPVVFESGHGCTLTDVEIGRAH